jgi:hypothetical protein
MMLREDIFNRPIFFIFLSLGEHKGTEFL